MHYGHQLLHYVKKGEVFTTLHFANTCDPALPFIRFHVKSQNGVIRPVICQCRGPRLFTVQWLHTDSPFLHDHFISFRYWISRLRHTHTTHTPPEHSHLCLRFGQRLRNHSMPEKPAYSAREQRCFMHAHCGKPRRHIHISDCWKLSPVVPPHAPSVFGPANVSIA